MNEKRKVIALGFFDGVHLGHQALLRKTAERALERDLEPAVFTFDRSPREFVTGVRVPLLTTTEEKRRVVRELFSIREVIAAPFDGKMMTLPNFQYRAKQQAIPSFTSFFLPVSRFTALYLCSHRLAGVSGSFRQRK